MGDLLAREIHTSRSTVEVDRDKWLSEYAASKLVVTQMRHRMNLLLSQAEPLSSLGLNFDIIEILFTFIQHGDQKRMFRELNEYADLHRRTTVEKLRS